MTLLTTTAELEAFCRPLHDVEFVTVDTEFIRERTYWPVLCLVQIGGPDAAVAVDALADGMDLAPLFELMANERVQKVFHAARQDLEIFYHLTGEMPTPVFDTQVAAMVCGFGDSVSYEVLVSKLARTGIDKASRFTDWSLRPLSDKQLAYALADVTHLRKVYEKLLKRLDENERLPWVAAEMKALAEPATYVTDPTKAFERIKVRGGKPRVLAVLREVAAWREREAQRADVPRGRVLRDEALVEIAHNAPDNPKKLARVRGLSTKMAEGWQGEQLLEAINRGKSLPDAECPTREDKQPLPRGIGPTSDLLKVLLKMRAEESDVAQRLIASSADVDRIAGLGEDADVPALTGWRRELFGAEALKLRRGELALAIKNRKVSVVDLDAGDRDAGDRSEDAAE